MSATGWAAGGSDDRDEQRDDGAPARREGLAGLLKRGFTALGSVIVPPVCLNCQAALAGHDALCAECWRDIAFIRAPLCDRLGLPLPFGGDGGPLISAAAAASPPVYDRARAVAVFRHKGVLQRLIHGLKYYDRHDARHLFGRWLVAAGGELIEAADLVVPVPLARWRLVRRQFNQSAMLAQELARLTGRPWSPSTLLRRKATPPQVGLTREQRRANVRGAFVVPARRRAMVAGRRILLVDDVITTGATVEAAARALRRAGAAHVDVLAIGLVTDPRAVTI